MGPVDMDEPDPGHGHAPGSERTPELEPTSSAPGKAEPASGNEAAVGNAPHPRDGVGPVPENAGSFAGGESAGSTPGDAVGSAPEGGGAAAGNAAADPPAGDAPAGGTAPGGAAVPPVPPGAGPAAPMPPDHHSGRKKKILAWTAGGVAVVVLLALGGAYAVYRHLNGNIHQVNISGNSAASRSTPTRRPRTSWSSARTPAMAWARATGRA